ncbi:MAG: DinB family protein [Vicinamibacteria bacterium]
MNARELLIETTPSIAPARALEALSPEQAEHREGSLHTVVEIVSHCAFWQDWFRSRCQGGSEPMPASASLGWTAPVPGSWPDVRRRFLDGLEALVALGEREDGTRVLVPPLEFPPLAGYTVGDVLVHVSNHNTHHLGQVIVLRQLMGAWPPPSGSWTW